MEVYKFISAKWGFESLKSKNLLVSNVSTLNDPFELLPMRLENRKEREEWNKKKKVFSNGNGLICFSSSWRSPVMWAHYANNSNGMVLGFTVPKENLKPVVYSTKRLFEMDAVENFEEIVATKFWHWRYEKEYRWVVPWSEAIEDADGNAFLQFGPNLKLNKVFLGPNYSREKADSCGKKLQDDLEKEDIQFITTRPAFKSFMFVKQNLNKLQKSL